MSAAKSPQPADSSATGDTRPHYPSPLSDVARYGVADPDATRQSAAAPEPDATGYTPTAYGPSRPRERRLPRPFGYYELLEEIARGGMGVVYKARDTRLNHIVALKMILAGRHSSDAAREQFLREAKASLSLQHEYILPIHEFNEVEGQPYFTMPWMPGGTLQQLLSDGPLPPQVAARLVQQLALAVQHAHDHGVLHRDLKPHNILLAGGGRETDEGTGGSRPPPAELVPKLADFGLARMEVSDSTRTGELKGTPSYMAPEQARGEPRKIGPGTDVYGLGAVLYCLLTARPPFQAADRFVTLMQVCEHEPVPPRRLNPQVPRDLETVCLKCLEKDLARRYPTAAALEEDLGRFLGGEPVRARPVGKVEQAWRWCKRNPAVASLLTALLLALLAGTVVAWVLVLRAEGEAAIARENAKKALEAKERAQFVAYAFRLREAQAELERGQLEQTKNVLRQCDPGLCGWEHDYLLRQTIREKLSCGGHTTWVSSVAFSPDGERIVSGSFDPTVSVWDAQTGQEVLTSWGTRRTYSLWPSSPTASASPREVQRRP